MSKNKEAKRKAKKSLELTFAGRFMPLKHPEYALQEALKM